MSRIKVGIVCGGKSSEHEISCISAAGVLSAINLDKYEPLLIGITKSGTWVLPPADYPLTKWPESNMLDLVFWLAQLEWINLLLSRYFNHMV